MWTVTIYERIFTVTLNCRCHCNYILYGQNSLGDKKGQEKNKFIKGIAASLIAIVVSFVGFGVTTTPEEKAMYQAKREAEKAEKQKQEQAALEEKQRKEQEKKAEEERKATEQKQAEEAKAAEPAKIEPTPSPVVTPTPVDDSAVIADFEGKMNNIAAKVDNDWAELWQTSLAGLSNGSVDQKTAYQNLQQLSHRLVDDEMLFRDTAVPSEATSEHRSALESAKRDYAEWAKKRREACDKMRLMVMKGTFPQQTMAEVTNLINTGDALVMSGAAKIVQASGQ